MAKIKALVKDPGKAPEIMEVENTLEGLQELIGGFIEVVTKPNTPMVMLVDEEGKMKGLPMNFMDYQIDDFIVGRAVFLGVDREEFTDVPADLAEAIIKSLPAVDPVWWGNA